MGQGQDPGCSIVIIAWGEADGEQNARPIHQERQLRSNGSVLAQRRGHLGIVSVSAAVAGVPAGLMAASQWHAVCMPFRR
jgi:hypothetical protein